MATTPNTPKLLPKDTGLLAFLYKVYTDQATADAFQSDPWTTMQTTFQLDPKDQLLIWASGLDRDAPENEAAWAEIRAGRLPAQVAVSTLKDVRWANAGWEADIAARLVHLMTDDPDVYETVW